MRFLDVLVYVVALGAVLLVLFASDSGQDAPPPMLPEEEGPLLPPSSVFDEQILIQVESPKDGLGTAFAVNTKGQWVTARHVVDGCESVSLLVGPGQYVPVEKVTVDPNRDLALITTGRSPSTVTLNLDTPLRKGARGYHVGYPQGRPGEVVATLLSRSKLVSRGLRNGQEPVLAWAEIGRTRGLMGSLGGISGGPVFDASGSVLGVIVAESPRRGRIYTTTPVALGSFLESNGVQVEEGEQLAFDVKNYGPQSDKARRKLQVVKVACRVSE